MVNDLRVGDFIIWLDMFDIDWLANIVVSVSCWYGSFQEVSWISKMLNWLWSRASWFMRSLKLENRDILQQVSTLVYWSCRWIHLPWFMIWFISYHHLHMPHELWRWVQLATVCHVVSGTKLTDSWSPSTNVDGFNHVANQLIGILSHILTCI